MTIKKLKEMISILPDDMKVLADDGVSLFTSNSEFVCISSSIKENKAVFQTKNDIDVKEETSAMLAWFSECDEDEQDAWIELYERGYRPEDFYDSIYAKQQFEYYGLDK